MWLDMSLGKLQPVTEPVLTPLGWLPIGWLSAGDYVIGANGQPTLVEACVFHQSKPIYKVTMNDGSWTLCGGEHLWAVRSPAAKMRGKEYKVITTQELLEGGLRDSAGNLRWHIPIAEPAQLLARDLPIDPYLLGVILGDGSINNWGTVVLTTDKEIADNWEGVEREHPSGGIVEKRIKQAKKQLIELGLAGKRSWEKSVPGQYLVASISQRHALLQGLLDTDAYPIQDGGVEFSSTAEPLIDAVVYLAQSLGGTGRKSAPRNTKYQGGIGRTSWRVNVKLPPEMPPFRLKRKLDNWAPPKGRSVARLISSIEPHSISDAVCIKVAAKDGLYVTRDFIVTHNTVIALTTLQQRQQSLSAYRALALGPRLVVETVWRQEIDKWEHLQGMRALLLRGPTEKKLRDLHRKDCDLHLCNYESIPWLVRTVNEQFLSRGKYLPWNMIIIDELDRLKHSMGKRYQLIEKLFPYFTYRIGMTGTLASNGYIDLHGQYRCIDDGERLYHNLTDFRNKWFKAGYAEQSWDLLPEAKEDIEARIQDITLSMRVDDYLKLPDYQYSDHWVDIEPKIQKEYDRLEKEMFAQLDRHEDDPLDGEWDLEVHSALSARAKCRQLANGAVLNPDNSGTVMLVHDAKLEMLDSIVHESGGQPMLLIYLYRHDMHRIKQRYEKEGHKIGFLGPGVKDPSEVISRWNAKQFNMLMFHPLSGGHGTNLQWGGNTIVWFGLTDNLAYYQQVNARLRRQGQAAPNVHIRRILARNTIDVPIAQLLERKTATAEELRNAIEEYRRTK